MSKVITRRESSALINSLSAGVVPRIGLRHIAIGREKEITTFLRDLETIEDGGAAFRFISGNYGSGKTFLLQIIRHNAMERKFVVADADLSPERRLTGSQGQGLATYKELIQNLSIISQPEGGALETILRKWINDLNRTVTKELQLKPNDIRVIELVSERIYDLQVNLAEISYGFSFATVIDCYWRGLKTNDENLKQSALRWLRGEYTTKTEARKNLGVDQIIDDQTWYEFLKLLALFISMVGYKGLVLFIDEGVNLYKISHKIARTSNYEKLLTIFNDTMQGRAKHLGVFFSGTPQFINDERRGLYSYEALRSRLIDHQFSNKNLIDYNSPVIRLATLSIEELFLLTERLCEVHGAYYNYDAIISPEERLVFLESVRSRLGTDELLTPREIIRDFIGLLNMLQQDPELKFEDMINHDSFRVRSAEKDPEKLDDEDLFADFVI